MINISRFVVVLQVLPLLYQFICSTSAVNIDLKGLGHENEEF
jgi:hypothetical protein